MRVRKKLRLESDAIDDEMWRQELPIMQQHVHQTRCMADPIYQLLLFPNDPLPVYDPRTQELLYTTTFVDRILAGVKEMLKKRYGDALEQETLISSMFAALSDRQCDSRIKVFVLMFIIKWESCVCELIRDLYDPDMEGSLFGQESIDQYNTLLKLLDKWVAQTVDFPFSQFSIVELVTNFVDACTQEYIMGPFQ
jgi:hypothetical protein